MEWMILPLKRYAEFGGRSRRQEFWMYTLGITLLYIVLGLIVGVSAGIALAGSNRAAAGAGGMIGMLASMGLIAVVFIIIWLGLLIPTIAVSIRRLHDTDRSGWWLMLYIAPYLMSVLFSIGGAAARSGGTSVLGGLMSFISVIGGIVLLVFYCLRGTPGPNRFGPDPLGSTEHLADTFR